MTAIPHWRDSVARHEQPSLRHSLEDIATSVVPYLALTVAMYLSLDVSVWIALALAVPAAGFLLRTFIVFHDCAHGSFLPTKRGNLWLGRFTAFLVFQPFANWRHNHAVHHGTAGDLDRRGTGDVPTLTVAEYTSRSPAQRLGYRLFRSPACMCGGGLSGSRWSGPRIWAKKQRPRMRHSVWLTNRALATVIGAIFWFAFTDKETIGSAEESDQASMEKFKIMHRELLNRGIYLGPSGYEVGFISSAHTKVDLEKAKRAIFESLDLVFRK